MTLNVETSSNKFYPVSSVDNLNDLAVYVNGQGTYSTGGKETTSHTCDGLTFKVTASHSANLNLLRLSPSEMEMNIMMFDLQELGWPGNIISGINYSDPEW